MLVNYGVGEEFEDAFELIKYRLKTERDGFEFAGNDAQVHMIIVELETYFAERVRST